ncbi:imidazole glycerol phosphate synthase amidotransferase subunit [Gracilibacillus boraciitolerans JCM 21714]|uniref:Imidazole glycerol phosphate synthase subunit HisH n=1 Tax=Gracilibacillus boraciitolerans JCM 21714 TaxID=1298598 RepID=W4VE92_9BACI|nr:imidazole glycerol phosphate synthase subunit HisH [Gracilibacillus boraciitolerans]GAE91481.1 imidazole glycerol phosphate synthase amidotransferase subunit [Gracilibacillus boraciitolerans JCM 21714]
MIAIVDYGMGNVASVRTAFLRLGYEVEITDSMERLEQATHIILPGVGSFQAAVEEINQRNLLKPLRRLAKQKPFLGICLGMQLLFEKGYENGISDGLGLIPGEVDKIETEYILPHIGWNQLQIENNNQPFASFQDKHVYFVHSFQARTDQKYIVATADYGSTVPGIVQNGQIYGMQFHPEKSGEVGVDLLKVFMEETKVDRGQYA